MKFTAITEHHLYDKTFQRGARFVGRFVSVHVLRDYTAKRRMLAHPMRIYTNRIGLSVTKRIGGAVERNRAKRIIRAALQGVEAVSPLKTGYLVVISARPTIVGRTSTEIEKELRYCFHKLDMFTEKNA